MNHLQLPVKSKAKSLSFLLVSAFVILATAIGIGLYTQRDTSASVLANFKPGNIISDAVMSNKNSMTKAQIQSFLKSKASSCTSKGPYSNGSYYIDKLRKTHNGTRAETNDGKYWWYIKNGHFVCMAEASFGGQSAADIIYEAAQDYSINPQVIIVLLQKEQGLITDSFPNSQQYNTATGYGCPDNADCDKQYYGLRNQIRLAAQLFREVLDGGWSNYPVGRNYIQYNPSKSCGGSYVNIENRATSALYRYTPYQPNKAALEAGYGTAPCGAYGNRNFYLFFNDWFGSTQIRTHGGIKVKHDQLGGNSGSLGSPLENERCGLVSGGCVQPFENGVIYWTSRTKAHAVVGAIGRLYENMSSERSALGYPASGEIQTSSGGVYQEFENGQIYWKRSTGAVVVHGAIGSKYKSLGASNSDLGHPIDKERCSLPGNGCVQNYEGGKIVWSSNTGAFFIENAIYDRWIGVAGNNLSYVGFPTSDPIEVPEGVYQNFKSGLIHKNIDGNVFVVGGGVYRSYSNVGNNIANVGMPINNESCDDTGCSQEFKRGNAYWTSKTGGYTVWGGIRTKYLSTGAQNGYLGYPISEELLGEGGGAYRKFENGYIYWKSGIGAYTTYGSIGRTYVSMGAERSRLGYPVSEERSSGDGGRYQEFENGSILWKPGHSAWVEV